MDLANRVTLITGGKRIGGVVAEQLARGGADIALVYRSSRGEAEDAAAAVRGYGRIAVVMQADLRDPDACARVVDQTVDALGRLDILVNMASVYRAVAFDDLTTDDWNEPLEVDLRAAFLCTQAAVPVHAAAPGRPGGEHLGLGGRERASALSRATCRTTWRNVP